MNKCSNPDHPHCTLWVMPDAPVCAAGHAQPAVADALRAPSPVSSFDLLSAARAARQAPPPAGASTSAGEVAVLPQQFPQILPHASAATGASASTVLQRPHLHVSGFDPRAAGGRQAIKLDLRGMAPGGASQVGMRLRSALIAGGGSHHQFERTTRGDWRPVFVEFSSRDMEHGQYQVDVELDSVEAGSAEDGAPALRRWVCTMLLLVPRADASLTDIHHTFLATHKNVRVLADDASIARVNGKVNGASGGGRVDIDVTARNASIAHLDFEAAGKVDLGFSSIAWDEDLIEIDVPAQPLPHPFPSTAACLVDAAPDHGAQRQVRLFSLDECVLGRWEQYDPHSDVLLAHYTENGFDQSGLTRRLSGRHAIIRRGERGFEIEDVSRYGILLDGVWPGKHHPVPLRLGMKIEMTASIKGVVVLNVSAILPHGVILHRIDAGAAAECLYLLVPQRHPGFPLPACEREACAAVMPVLFHRDGGFWHLDTATGAETALHPALALDRLVPFQRHVRFAAEPYPESWIIRTPGGALQQPTGQPTAPLTAGASLPSTHAV